MEDGIVRTRIVLIAVSALVVLTAAPAGAHDDQHSEGWHGNSRAEELANAFLADSQPIETASALSETTCDAGFADIYPCSNVDLMAFLPLADIGGGSGNDVWGWTDPVGGKEYALMGRSTGTSFVDITDPVNPIYLGNLPTSSRFSSSWRDIKVYNNHAFIVSEARRHGMQVFDLTQLRGLTSAQTFSETAHYSGFNTAHNIVINEVSGFAYVVGANTCSGGLDMIDISNPTSPTDAGCYSGDGYTHDAQCVDYIGPDTDHAGKELCLASNEDTLTIVDVTNKSAPTLISRTGYAGSEYTHQGWLTEDQRYFLLDDELDERNNGHNTRTYVFDLADVDNPVLVGSYTGASPSIDHNQYVVGDHSFQANYRSGLRVLDITGVGTAALSEVAFFDIYPADDAPEFNGAWSNYPFFASGIVVVSGIEQGLFILRPNLGPVNAPPSVSITSPVDGAIFNSGVSVDFAGTASDDEDGDLTASLVWTSNLDGQIGIGGSFNTVLSDGIHTVTASVTDSGGNTSSDSITVTVGNMPPTASFTYNCTDLDCVFTDTSTDSDGSVVSWSWNLGDGATSTVQNPSHTFSSSGTYTVSLTVTDNDGAIDTTSQEVTVSDGGVTLTGRSISTGRTWTAEVTVGGSPGDSTSGTWDYDGSSGGCEILSGTSCTFDLSGIPKQVGSVTYTDSTNPSLTVTILK